MNESAEKSGAFRQALLKSERLRIFILLGAVGAGFIIRSLRTAFHPNHENVRLWLLTTVVVALFVAYESLGLRAVNRATQNGRDLARGMWISSVVLETCLPAFGIVFLSSSAIDPLYRPLANPAALLFFILIVLSTLRLNPGLCILSGLVAAVSYLAAAVYIGWRPFVGPGASLLSPQKTVFAYALTFAVAGVVAGVVAREIRKHVDAALREAELQRQVERLEHDLRVARSIQRSLLPTAAPQIEGFEIAGWNQPADQTGGDYYDWYPRPDGKVLVALADVTGHGIGPALLAADCRAYARANFASGGDGLLSAMERINSLLSRDLGEGRFVTFVTALCSPGNSHVELLSAGHGPLLLYSLKEDRFDERDAQGLPLGISPSLISEPPLTVELNPGDMLILATDGFFEWANAQGDQFEIKRLEETIRRSREKPASEIISTLYQAVIDFSSGTKQQDDLTAVVIKRR
jgi:serine phosphatase RsbU (regulator of sigma subunit)